MFSLLRTNNLTTTERKFKGLKGNELMNLSSVKTAWKLALSCYFAIWVFPIFFKQLNKPVTNKISSVPSCNFHRMKSCHLLPDRYLAKPQGRTTHLRNPPESPDTGDTPEERRASGRGTSERQLERGLEGTRTHSPGRHTPTLRSRQSVRLLWPPDPQSANRPDRWSSGPQREMPTPRGTLTDPRGCKQNFLFVLIFLKSKESNLCSYVKYGWTLAHVYNT